jgi:hypothetical protein
VEDVADLLDEVSAANELLAEEMDRMGGFCAAVSQETAARFLRLAQQLRDGARAWATLVCLGSAPRLVGDSAWRARRRLRGGATAARRTWACCSGEATS